MEVSIARPATFVAVPLDRAYGQLISKYQKEMNDRLLDLRKVKDQLEELLKTQEARDDSFEKDRFQIIKGFNSSSSRMVSALSRARLEAQLAMRREKTLQLEKIGFFDILRDARARKGFQARLLLDRGLKDFLGSLGRNVRVEWARAEAITHEVFMVDDEVFYSLKDSRDSGDALFASGPTSPSSGPCADASFKTSGSPESPALKGRLPTSWS